MAVFLAPIINDQQEDANGNPLTGGLIEVYLAGTSTPSTTYSDKAGLVPNSWPIVLNTLGLNQQGAVWITGGSAYKFVIKNSSGVVQRTIDNIGGINDSTFVVDQWVVYQGTPTYISATSFSVPGDQTQTFQPYRRIKSANTGGTIYSTILTSSYSAPNTNITVANDTGALDSGLSQVWYGLISTESSSVVGRLLNVRVFTANTTYTPTPGTQSIIAHALGGGGGGGGSSPTSAGAVGCGGGGTSGVYAVGRFTGGFAGLAITIGGAGAAGAISSNGGNGGATSLGGILIAPGGVGGQTGGSLPITFAYVNGTPGTATGANIFSQPSQLGSPGWGSFAAGIIIGGGGGASPFGSGGYPSATSITGNVAGNGSGGFGSGGGGCATGESQGGAAGASGRQGILIIYEYA